MRRKFTTCHFLAQQNGFGQSVKFSQFPQQARKRVQQSCAPAREECNKYDLISAPYFSLANHYDWSRWFAISSLPPIFSPSFTLMGGVAKEGNN
jgi:hypothetical protein